MSHKNCQRVYTMTQGREFDGSTNRSVGNWATSGWEFGSWDQRLYRSPGTLLANKIGYISLDLNLIYFT